MFEICINIYVFTFVVYRFVIETMHLEEIYDSNFIILDKNLTKIPRIPSKILILSFFSSNTAGVNIQGFILLSGLQNSFCNLRLICKNVIFLHSVTLIPKI